ncbi:hypothetical protein [Ferruginibacter albus]|uniref:hypothetical protein n=1 Tax=Ferruginibacter albus TaxID=2875540 RepID=UPI001CC6BF83|nr:hypothetical protein [Ferruginibacter albus]UAY53221.1 hypothetical protein K9M53_06005 [Ferruginibacter albus]
MVTLKNEFIKNLNTEDKSVYPRVTVCFHDGLYWQVAGYANTTIKDGKLFADLEISNPKFNQPEVYIKAVTDNGYLHSILLIDPKNVFKN